MPLPRVDPLLPRFRMAAALGLLVASVVVGCGRTEPSSSGTGPSIEAATSEPASTERAAGDGAAAVPAAQASDLATNLATKPETTPESAAEPAPGGATAAAVSAPGGAAAGAPAVAPALGPVHRLSVLDLDGNPVPLAKFAGRPMIIEIWATWCGPCRVNRKNIHEMKPQFPERLLVIGVSYDGAGGGPDAGAGALVRRFLQTNPANEHEFLASREFREFINQRSTSNSIPKTLYVTGKGHVVDLSEGVQGRDWVRGMARNLK